MPTYGGGKSRIGKQIFQVIKQTEKDKKWNGDYFEPFCGLIGVGLHFLKEGRNISICDKNKDLMLMWKKLKNGWIPPLECSKDDYEVFKKMESHSAERGFVGIGCAYSGIYFAGYRQNTTYYLKLLHKGLLKLVPFLHKADILEAKPYYDFNPTGKTIYCDPPYKNNKLRSEHFKSFDTDKFWNVMRSWSKTNLVIISEYEAPDDFECIWEKDVNSTFNNKCNSYTEKLFIYKGIS
jgi:DNA adenine methylase